MGASEAGRSTPFAARLSFQRTAQLLLAIAGWMDRLTAKVVRILRRITIIISRRRLAPTTHPLLARLSTPISVSRMPVCPNPNK